MSEQNHPPPFSPTQRLSHWIGCTLEIRCPRCPRAVLLPIRLLQEMAIAASTTLLRPYGVDCVVVVQPRYIWWLDSTDSVAEVLVLTGQSR